MWWMWALIAWPVVGLLVAVLVGRSIRLADRWSTGTDHEPLTTAALDEPSTAVAPRRAPRRRLPLPALGVALAATSVTLASIGFVVRASGARGQLAQVFSLDGTSSVLRMFVAGIFGVAACAALLAASRPTGRRAWWTAVGAVAGGIAVVKAAGTAHAAGFWWLRTALGTPGAVLAGVLLAGTVLAALWLLSRHERRDRRRVIGSLGLYAVAAVGLSSVGALVSGGQAARWGLGLTFLEEAVEALGAVALLVAVLAGVAPRVVLPAGWALRRTADAETLDAPGVVTERPVVRWGRAER